MVTRSGKLFYEFDAHQKIIPKPEILWEASWGPEIGYTHRFNRKV